MLPVYEPVLALTVAGRARVRSCVKWTDEGEPFSRHFFARVYLLANPLGRPQLLVVLFLNFFFCRVAYERSVV